MSDYGSRGYRDYGGEPSHSGRRRGYDHGGYDHGDYDSYEPRRRSSGAARASASVGSPHDEPTTSGRARVPSSDSSGPGRARGSARVGGRRRAGRELSEEESKAVSKKKKRKRRRRVYIAMGCVMAIFLGVGVVVGSLFFQNVPLPDNVGEGMEQSSTVAYSDGTEMGKVGNSLSNRKLLKFDDIPEDVKWALLSAEDRRFYEHNGMDFAGVMRALWNNVSGGDRQGGSTLTVQYVGAVGELRDDDSYMRKGKEAVMAMKMDDEYSKDQIIEHYLNLIYMGRGAYGLGTAAEVWFEEEDEDENMNPKSVEDLNASEAAVIFAQVKEPVCTYDPKEPCDLDPEQVAQNLEGRWQYILDGMVDMGKLDQETYDAYMEEGVPETADTTSSAGDEGADDPTGFVSHKHVMQEVEAKVPDIDEQGLRTQGYTVNTTIDPDLQKALEEVARAEEDGGDGYMADHPNNLRAGAAIVEPGTGEVLAYYGGTDDGNGVDKAGLENMHTPGSAFKTFTLVAALQEDYSIKTLWDGESPRFFPDRVDEDGEENPLHNSGEGEGRSVHTISLEEAIVDSLNTPMYAIADEIGADTIVQTAADMGITRLQNPGDGEMIDLTDDDVIQAGGPREPADNEVSFGQYPVSVLDMATANATLANKGEYVETHFVKSVEDANGDEVYTADPEKRQVLGSSETEGEAIAGDVAHVLEQVQPNDGDVNLHDRQTPSAGKTGTWERICPDEEPECRHNSALWYAGYTPHLAGAVWVGDEEDENGEVNDEYGNPAFGAGASAGVYREFMQRAYEEGDFEPGKFPERSDHGDDDKGERDRPEEDDEGEEEECEPGSDNFPDCLEDGDNPPEECEESDPFYPHCDDPDRYCEENPDDELCIDDDCDWIDYPECDDEPGVDGDGDRSLPATPSKYSSGAGASSHQYAVREEHALIR